MKLSCEKAYVVFLFSILFYLMNNVSCPTPKIEIKESSEDAVTYKLLAFLAEAHKAASEKSILKKLWQEITGKAIPAENFKYIVLVKTFPTSFLGYSNISETCEAISKKKVELYASQRDLLVDNIVYKPIKTDGQFRCASREFNYESRYEEAGDVVTNSVELLMCTCPKFNAKFDLKMPNENKWTSETRPHKLFYVAQGDQENSVFVFQMNSKNRQVRPAYYITKLNDENEKEKEDEK